MNLAGGKVKRIPPRTMTPTGLNINKSGIKHFDIPKKTKLEDLIDKAFNERDKLIEGLLDLDNKYDIIQDTINDQIKNMDIPVTNRSVREAVRAFGGNGDKITDDIYKKAKKTAEAIPTILGLNPLHVPFAKPTDVGKSLTQNTGDILDYCHQIDPIGFPNAVPFKLDAEQSKNFGSPYSAYLEEDGVGSGGKNEDGTFLTTISDLLNKAKYDIKEFIVWELFWNKIYKKFLAYLIVFHPKIWAGFLKPWMNKKIIGKFVRPLYCLVLKFIFFFENIPEIFGLRPPNITGDKRFLKGPDGKQIHDLSFEYSEDEEIIGTKKLTGTRASSVQPFKNEGIYETEEELANCSEDGKEGQNKIDKDMNPDERKKQIAKKMQECILSMKFGGEETIDGLKDEEKVIPDPCIPGKFRALVEYLTDIMGQGINKNTPFNNGFIPIPCYEYAQTILNTVNQDALNGRNMSYNPDAIFLDKQVIEMRDFHELSKSMIYMIDDSDGSKALMENTASNLKYKQMFLSKDQIDYRNANFGV